MRSVRAEFHARLRQSGAHELDGVSPEVHHRQRLVLLPRLGRGASGRDSADQGLDGLALAGRSGALDTGARVRLVARGSANRDRDDALEALESDAVELVAAEKVEEDRLELGKSRVGVPQVGVRLDGREVEQRDSAGGRFDALREVQRAFGQFFLRRECSSNGVARTLKSDICMTSSIPTSSISMTSPPKQRAQTRPWGRFLVWVPMRKSEASFLTDQKLSEVASSNGRIWFDLEKLIELGFLSWFCAGDSTVERTKSSGMEGWLRMSVRGNDSAASVASLDGMGQNVQVPRARP